MAGLFSPRGQPALRPEVILGLVVAGFAAVNAIVLPVFAKPRAEIGLAERAVLGTNAALLALITDDALEFFPRHRIDASAAGGPACEFRLNSHSSDDQNQPSLESVG